MKIAVYDGYRGPNGAEAHSGFGQGFEASYAAREKSQDEVVGAIRWSITALKARVALVADLALNSAAKVTLADRDTRLDALDADRASSTWDTQAQRIADDVADVARSIGDTKTAKALMDALARAWDQPIERGVPAWAWIAGGIGLIALLGRR